MDHPGPRHRLARPGGMPPQHLQQFPVRLTGMYHRRLAEFQGQFKLGFQPRRLPLRGVRMIVQINADLPHPCHPDTFRLG